MTAALPARPCTRPTAKGLGPEEGPPEHEEAVGRLGVLPGCVGAVDVQVRPLAVGVLVDVEAAAAQVPHHLEPQQHQHDPHAELEDGGQGLVAVQDRLFQQEDDDAQEQKRRGVA